MQKLHGFGRDCPCPEHLPWALAECVETAACSVRCGAASCAVAADFRQDKGYVTGSRGMLFCYNQVLCCVAAGALSTARMQRCAVSWDADANGLLILLLTFHAGSKQQRGTLDAEAAACVSRLLATDESDEVAVMLLELEAHIPRSALIAGCCSYLDGRPPSLQPPLLELRGARSSKAGTLPLHASPTLLVWCMQCGNTWQPPSCKPLRQQRMHTDSSRLHVSSDGCSCPVLCEDCGATGQNDPPWSNCVR